MNIDEERAKADNRYLTILKDIVLGEIPDSYAIFLFGSRAREEKKRSSDADIGIIGPAKLPHEIKARIRSLIEESIIPFKVDLVDFYQVSSEFKNIAMQEIKIWRCPKTISLV